MRDRISEADRGGLIGALKHAARRLDNKAPQDTPKYEADFLSDPHLKSNSAPGSPFDVQYSTLITMIDSNNPASEILVQQHSGWLLLSKHLCDDVCRRAQQHNRTAWADQVE